MKVESTTDFVILCVLGVYASLVLGSNEIPYLWWSSSRGAFDAQGTYSCWVTKWLKCRHVNWKEVARSRNMQRFLDPNAVPLRFSILRDKMRAETTDCKLELHNCTMFDFCFWASRAVSWYHVHRKINEGHSFSKEPYVCNGWTVLSRTGTRSSWVPTRKRTILSLIWDLELLLKSAPGNQGLHCMAAPYFTGARTECWCFCLLLWVNAWLWVLDKKRLFVESRAFWEIQNNGSFRLFKNCSPTPIRFA